MKRRPTGALAIAALLVLACAAHAQPVPSYEFVPDGSGADGLELRFHNLKLKSVHADDSQNALALDFDAPADGALFDRLAAEMPQWISLAYANFDNGVIRAARPVTFLTRPEPDGFSLKLIPRGTAPLAAPRPLALRGQLDGAQPPPAFIQGPPPPPNVFHRYDDYGAVRNYDALELAVRRGDPMAARAYDRAAMRADSALALDGEWQQYRGGDTVIASHADIKYSFMDGIAFVGELGDTDLKGWGTRAPDGSIALSVHTNLVTGVGGLAFELGDDSELRLEASEGNNLTGGRLGWYSGGRAGYWLASLDYHVPDLDTPTAVWARADKDQATLATARELGWGFWGNLAAHGTRYGVHGDSDVAVTAGWDGGLRWSSDIFGVTAGLVYDGHGEYLLSHDSVAGAPPTPYTPLGIRNMEDHAVTASISQALWDGLWFDIYGGYAVDRYAGDGMIEGAELRYILAPGAELALGARHSAVSFTQGETGGETSGGLSFTLGFGDPPRPTWLVD